MSFGKTVLTSSELPSRPRPLLIASEYDSTMLQMASIESRSTDRMRRFTYCMGEDPFANISSSNDFEIMTLDDPALRSEITCSTLRGVLTLQYISERPDCL